MTPGGDAATSERSTCHERERRHHRHGPRGGAGPVGLTTACQLARLGVPVRVVERLEQPTTESRAVGVHARSMEMLAALGVLPRLESRNRRIAALEMVDGRTGRSRARMELADAPTRHPYVLDVAQPVTEAVLADRAAKLGVVVERGVEVTALTQDAGGVEVTLRSTDGERTERAGWVVGADGGHSTVRHRRPDGRPGHRAQPALADLLGTVLRVSGDAAGPDDLVDRDGLITRAYGLGSEGMALIRPDGYLGLVADSADPAVLRDYLADVVGVALPSTV